MKKYLKYIIIILFFAFGFSKNVLYAEWIVGAYRLNPRVLIYINLKVN